MKKLLVWAMMLMIGFGFVAEAAALEETVFGPRFIKKEKGKAKPVHFTFPATIDDECNCTLFVQPFRGNKVKVAVVLNGVEVVSSGDKFVDGEIEVPVNLLETNEIAITVSGKPGAAVRAGVIVTRPAPTEITLGCATRGASGTGMIAGATVEVQFLDGTVLSETTGADGFCYFPDIPVGTVALVTASTTDGRMSSALAVFSESKDHVAIDLQMFPPGPGKVSGTIETLGEPLEGIVSILFSKTGYRAATIADASGAFSFNGLPLDGYFTLSIATPGDVLRSGSISRNLTETQPTWENLDFSVKNPCPVNSTLFNGDFEQGTLFWKCVGKVGLGPQSQYFPEGDDNETCGEPQATSQEVAVFNALAAAESGSYCGLVCTQDGNNSTHSMSQKFLLNSNDAVLEFKWRFVTCEWPTGYGWLNHDQFKIKVVTQDSTHDLAFGDLTTVPVEKATNFGFGFFAISQVKTESFDLSNMAGQSIELVVEVDGLGDPLDSYIVFDDVKIIDKEELIFHSNGIWDLPRYSSPITHFKAGHILKFVFKNPGPIGTTIDIKEVSTEQQYFRVLLPFQSQEVVFSKPCSEPLDWRFFIHTESDMNNIVSWEAQSTWIPGMPELNK